MSVEWYNLIAKKNHGYKSNALYKVKGLSGEDVFEERLINMLPNSNNVLDAGCGHGEFTINMGSYANHIIGFDNSKDLLNIASELLNNSNVTNVEFMYGWTKGNTPLPFCNNQFDLIYARRGPTSIINHSRILKSGGIIFGIHSGSLNKVKKRLEENNFLEIEIKIFDEATLHFTNETEFIKYLSSIPGSPNYLLPEYENELPAIIKENTIGGKIVTSQWRYIWKAIKP